jgi:hypothetical protein
MADKKVSTLTEATLLYGTDLLMLVGNVATTPANYKVTVKNFLSKVNTDLATNTEIASLKVVSNLVGNGSVIQGAGEVQLNSGNSGIANANTYGFIITHSVVGANVATVSPVAFLGLRDKPTANVKTLYLFEAGIGSNGSVNTFVTANLTQANASVFVCKANTTTAAVANSIPATHQIRCKINGAEYWILASNVAPA